MFNPQKNMVLCFFLLLNLGLSQNLKLIWSDEFNGPNGPINSQKWFHQTQLPNGNSWWNGEIQHYTSRTDNAYISNGTLKIVAKKEVYKDQGHTKNYTSARLNSKFTFTYGRVEIKAKLPKGTGTWPAIWMLGKKINEKGAYWQTKGFGNTPWSQCGELDIMEHWGSNPNYVTSAIHTPSSYGNTINKGGQEVSYASDEFHIYAIDWSEQKMVFSVDGITHYTYNPSSKNSDTWPFDSEMYILLNIAIEPSIASNFTQSEMEIDYVRVYSNELSTSSQSSLQPTAFEISNIYPNPFNPRVNIDYEINQDNIINISVYNIDGKLIDNLFHEYQNAGKYTITWNASKHPSSIYFIRASSGKNYLQKKVTFLK